MSSWFRVVAAEGEGERYSIELTFSETDRCVVEKSWTDCCAFDGKWRSVYKSVAVKKLRNRLFPSKRDLEQRPDELVHYFDQVSRVRCLQYDLVAFLGASVKDVDKLRALVPKEVTPPPAAAAPPPPARPKSARKDEVLVAPQPALKRSLTPAPPAPPPAPRRSGAPPPPAAAAAAPKRSSDMDWIAAKGRNTLCWAMLNTKTLVNALTQGTEEDEPPPPPPPKRKSNVASKPPVDAQAHAPPPPPRKSNSANAKRTTGAQATPPPPPPRPSSKHERAPPKKLAPRPSSTRERAPPKKKAPTKFGAAPSSKLAVRAAPKKTTSKGGLTSVLAPLGLGRFLPALRELGVESVADAGILEDSDLAAIGMNRVQQIKLRRAVMAAAA